MHMFSQMPIFEFHNVLRAVEVLHVSFRKRWLCGQGKRCER